MKTFITILAITLLTSPLFSQGKLDYTLEETTSDGVNWSIMDKIEYLYDADDNLIQSTYITYDSGWTNSYQTIYTYDENNNKTQQIDSEWDNSTGQWLTQYKALYNYDDNNDLTLLTFLYWEDDAWKNEEKITISYYSAGKMNQYLAYEWEGSWQAYAKGTLAYNDENQFISILEEEWNGVSWENDENSLFAYNDEGQITEVVYQQWEDVVWQTYSKETYTLDTNTNRLSKIGYYYMLGEFEPEYKTAYNYDMTKLLSDYSHPFNAELYFFEDFPYHNKILNEKEYYYNEGVWDVSERYTYHYVEAAGIDETENELFYLYPNPTKDILFIDSSNNDITIINILDSTGKRIITDTTLIHNKEVNLSTLKTGFYIVEIIDNKGGITRKRILKE